MTADSSEMLAKYIDRFIATRSGKAPPAAPVRPRAAHPAAPAAKRQGSRQVFAGKLLEMPPFARDIEPSALVELCLQKAVCEYTPHIEQSRIYTPGRRDRDGNLLIEYEGILSNCGAIKNFGLAVAQEELHNQPYRYVDLNHVLACCCGKPEYCPFYLKATTERKRIEWEQRLKAEEQAKLAAEEAKAAAAAPPAPTASPPGTPKH